MGRQRVRDQQAGFAGGMNAVSDPAFLRPDQARQLANFRLSTFGAALKRLGTQNVAAAAITTFDTQNSAYGGVYWPLQGKVYATAAATGSTTMHLYSTTYGSFPRTWTDVGALPQFRPVLFTDVSNEIMYYAGDNNTAVYKFDGSSIAALGGGTPMVKGLCVYNDRLWGWSGAGASAAPGNFLYYSNLSSAVGSTGGDSIGDTAAGGGYIVVRTFGYSDIAACAPVNGTLLIWHARGISVLTGWGQDDVQVQPQALNATIGMGNATADGVCVANQLSTGDLAYFITDTGMYVTNGGYVKPLATPDKPDPTAALIAAGTTNPSKFIVRFNRQFNEVWVGIVGIGIYIYNAILESWSGPFTGTYASGLRALYEVTDTAGNAKLWRTTYGGSAGAGAVVSECDRTSIYKDDVASDSTGGTAVTATLQLHRMFAGDRLYSKTYRWVNVLAQLTSGATAPVAACTTSIGGTSNHTFQNVTSVQQPYYLSPGGDGPYIDVTITDTGTTGQSLYELAEVEGNFLGQR